MVNGSLPRYEKRSTSGDPLTRTITVEATGLMGETIAGYASSPTPGIHQRLP